MGTQRSQVQISQPRCWCQRSGGCCRHRGCGWDGKNERVSTVRTPNRSTLSRWALKAQSCRTLRTRHLEQIGHEIVSKIRDRIIVFYLIFFRNVLKPFSSHLRCDESRGGLVETHIFGEQNFSCWDSIHPCERLAGGPGSSIISFHHDRIGRIETPHQFTWTQPWIITFRLCRQVAHRQRDP